MSIQERMMKAWLERLSPDEMTELVDRFLPQMLKKLGTDGLKGVMGRLDPDLMPATLANMALEVRSRLASEALPSFLETTLAELPRDESLKILTSWSDVISSLEKDLRVRDTGSSATNR